MHTCLSPTCSSLPHLSPPFLPMFLKFSLYFSIKNLVLRPLHRASSESSRRARPGESAAAAAADACVVGSALFGGVGCVVGIAGMACSFVGSALARRPDAQTTRTCLPSEKGKTTTTKKRVMKKCPRRASERTNGPACFSKITCGSVEFGVAVKDDNSKLVHDGKNFGLDTVDVRDHRHICRLLVALSSAVCQACAGSRLCGCTQNAAPSRWEVQGFAAPRQHLTCTRHNRGRWCRGRRCTFGNRGPRCSAP